MKSRQHFEGQLSATMQERIAKSHNPKEEALWLIDVCMAAAFFCTGVIEKNIGTKPAMNRMFARAERVREEIEKQKRAASKKPPGTPDGGIDGNPLILPPGYEGN